MTNKQRKEFERIEKFAKSLTFLQACELQSVIRSIVDEKRETERAGDRNRALRLICAAYQLAPEAMKDSYVQFDAAYEATESVTVSISDVIEHIDINDDGSLDLSDLQSYLRDELDTRFIDNPYWIEESMTFWDLPDGLTKELAHDCASCKTVFLNSDN